MNGRDLSILGLVVVAFLLALAPMLGCTTLGPLVGKPDKVVIHHFGDLSGPYAPVTTPIVSGIKDFTEWFNEDGGIDGVPIVDVSRDTGGELDAVMDVYAAFKASRPYPIVTVVYDPAGCDTLRKLHLEDGILCFTNAASGKCIILKYSRNR